MPDPHFPLQWTQKDADRLNAIHVALIGDPLNQDAKPGFLAMVLRHDETLYGDEKHNVRGLDKRTDAIESTQREWKIKIGIYGGIVTFTLVTIIEVLKSWILHK